MTPASLRLWALTALAVFTGMLVFATQSLSIERRRDLVLSIWAGTRVERIAHDVDAFLSRREALPLDPWGREYQLREGPTPLSFTIVSAGPDGIFGTADDIRSRAK